MDMENRLEGIVLKVQSYKENDRLVFLYTKRGFITLVAKGSQKVTSPLRTIAQYMNLIEFKDSKDKNMFMMQDAKLIYDFQHIKTDYYELKEASIMLNWIQRFITDNDSHDEIYTLIREALLDYKKECVLSFSFKLLKYIGYPIQLKADGRPIKGLSLTKRSIIYLEENEKINLNLVETTQLLKLTYLSYDKIEKIEDELYNKLKSFLYNYLEYHTDIKLT